MPHQFQAINCKKCEENYCPVCKEVCPNCLERDVADAETMKIRQQMKDHMQTESKQQIIVRRKEIEQEMADMLKETKSDFSLQDVKDTIYHEEDNDDMTKVIMMFDRGGDVSELSNILELVTDAWNYFPHKALNGKAPVEMR